MSRTFSPTRAALVLLLATALPAGPSAAETLEQSWQEALGNDFALQAAFERMRAAEASLAGARAERRPTVTATGMLARFETPPAFAFPGLPPLPLFADRSATAADVRVSVPLFTGGRLGAQVDAADAQREHLRSQSAALTLDVKLGVAEAYIDVLRADSSLAVATANVSGLAAHARDVDDMYRTGQVPRNDALAATAALADAEQQELAARSRVEIARAAYNRSVGRALGSTVQLEATLPSRQPALSAQPLEALTELAAGNRHELAALTAAAEALQAQSAAARATGWPQLAATGGYTRFDNEFLQRDEYWSVALSLQWTLFDSGRRKQNGLALSRESAALERERENLSTLIEFSVRETWLSAREAEQRIEVTVNAVEQAEENLRVVRDRYRNGESTNTEVLDAETLWRQSESNYDAARYDAAIAEFRLARAVGVL